VQPSNILIIEYDIIRFNFRRWFEEALGVRELELLHESRIVTADNFVEECNFFRAILEPHADELLSLLLEFSEEVIRPIFGAIRLAQAKPTFRVYLAIEDERVNRERRAFETLSLREFLTQFYLSGGRERAFHRDNDYGVHSSAVNLWLPVTAAAGTNCLWINGRGESVTFDARPTQVRVGECLFFEGAGRWHGSVWNTSGRTRVSFDWRFIPSSPSVTSLMLHD
jgi:hypothetical protein